MHWCDLVWYCNIIPQVLHVLTDSGQMQQFTINCTNIAKLWYFFERLLVCSIYIAKTKKQGISRQSKKIVILFLYYNIFSQYPSHINVPLKTCWRYVKACYLPYASPLWNKKSNAIHQISCSKLQCLPYFKLLVNFSFGISSLTAIKIFADF